MKKILMMLTLLAAGAGWASTDMKTFLDAQTITGEFAGWTAGETYTLSEDYTLKRTDTGAITNMRFGRNCTYDFDEGVTFKVSGVRFYGDNTASTFTFKGGIWDFNGSGSFSCAGWNNLPYNNYTWDLDGVVITNQGTWSIHGGYGYNRTLRAKNSIFYMGGACNYLDAAPAVSTSFADKPGGVSSLIEFGPNTKLIGTQYVYDNRNNTSAAMQNGIIRFTGAGTVYSGKADGSRGSAYLSIGSAKASPGYRLEILDGALVNIRDLHFGETSWSNAVYIANATMTNEYSSVIGTAATATDNEFVVAGANGVYHNMDSLDVGQAGSRNALIVTNGATASVKTTLRVGNGASVSNKVLVAGNAKLSADGDLVLGKDGVDGGNEVRIEDSTLQLAANITLDVHGINNSLVLDNATVTAQALKIGKNSIGGKITISGADTSLSFMRPGIYSAGGTIWYPFDSANDGGVVEITDGVELSMARLHLADSASNATLRITNNAKVTVAEYFWMGSGAAMTNQVCEISNGGMVTTGSMRPNGSSGGSGNTYIVDNGTVRFYGSQGVFFTGANTLRVRGTSPKFVAYNDDAAQCQFRDQTQVYIELPTNGEVYAEAPFQGYGISWHSTAALHIVNAAECFEALNCSTNIPLVRMTTTGVVGNYIPQSVLDAANAELPDGVSVVYATTGKGLDIQVKKSRGLIFMLTGPKTVPVALTFDDGCPGQLQVAEPMLAARGWKGTFNICTGYSGPNTMSWDQIRELYNRGHEIASHSWKHARLSELIASSDTERLNREIAGSRQDIYDQLGVYPTWYCVPYIEYNDTINTLVEAAGMHVMTIPRIPFGDGYPADKDYTKKLMEELAKKPKALDILIHGITKEYGGWNPFDDAAEFGRFLDAIKALEIQGLIKVVTYAEAYAAFNE